MDRSLVFYRDVLGFELQQRIGDQAAFLSMDGYHHHIALNTWHSRGGKPPARNMTGLFHTAILYPNGSSLAQAVRRVIGAGIALDGAADHGVSRAVYLSDPDENGVELYVDYPETEWPRDKPGALIMDSKPLNVDNLLMEADE